MTRALVNSVATNNSKLKTQNSTIAAIATPAGTGGIGVVRISGPEAFDVASRIFTSRPVSDLPSHTAHHGVLVRPDTGDEIDDVVLTVFKAPASYTGEDVVEVSCHGGVATVRAALNAVLAAGARLAEPGEFTKRAFLNGKLDLSQAEAVNDLIRSRTDEARKVALRQLDGALSRRVSEIRDHVLGVLASVEAAIDFPEDVDEPDPAWLESELGQALGQIDELVESFGKGRVYREGIRVVIAGRVNVGKSSLLNALLRHARAIVTPIPGTTRDTIEENLEIRGIPVVAIDTAGVRATSDPIERLGVELAEKSLESADIILLVFDISEGITNEDAEVTSRVEDKPAIVVLNKIDLLPEEARSPAVEEFFGRLGRSLPVVRTCASSGSGIDLLEDAIASLVGASDLGSESAVVSNIRHKDALDAARESLSNALATLSRAEPIDLLSVDLNAARSSLGLITGETATDDLLDRIFREFCVGK